VYECLYLAVTREQGRILLHTSANKLIPMQFGITCLNVYNLNANSKTCNVRFDVIKTYWLDFI